MRKILWATVAYTLLVIVWGAWVRISHSGDGCGASWPFCKDQLIPFVSEKKTWIEYTHRAMSGIYGILVLGLLIAVQKSRVASQETRFWMRLTFFFMITEALLGATLVKKGFVGTNDSPHRAMVMALHFANSLFLTGTLALTALFSEASVWRKIPWTEVRGVSIRLLRRIPIGTMLIFLLVGLTGTVAALSNTLYPSNSLLAGLAADLDPSSHYLLRLRGLHPMLGLFLGIGLVIFFYLVSEALEASQKTLKNRAFLLAMGFASLVIVGALTLLLETPLPLRLLHLTLAHTLWILILSFWQRLRFSPAG